jgi:hypothetical protein
MASAPRPEAVEVFQPGHIRSSDEQQRERQEISTVEEQLRDGKYRLVVDLSMMSREELARVSSCFRLRTMTREVFFSPSGNRLQKAEPGVNGLIGERPDVSRIPQSVATAAERTLGKYHNAQIICYFTDETAAVLYRALARTSQVRAFKPGETLELQLRPATDGRIEAVALGTRQDLGLSRRP